MTHVFKSSGIVATLDWNPLDNKEPTVQLTDVPGIPGTHKFLARSFLEHAAAGRQTFVCQNFPDQAAVVITSDEVAEFAQLIRSFFDTPLCRRHGRFEIKWVEGDPKHPF